MKRTTTKGALQNVLAVCTHWRQGATIEVLTAERIELIQSLYSQWSAQGYRVLGVVEKQIPEKMRYRSTDEIALVFSGFLLFFDPPEPQVQHTCDCLLRGIGVC